MLPNGGKRGQQDGQFDEPVALCLNPENDFLVTLDKGNYRVQEFGLNGEFWLSFGQRGSREGMFENPVDITVDNMDYVYVVDRDRGVILKFHKSGDFVGEWGNRGIRDERLQDPVSITYSDHLTGFLYVLDLSREDRKSHV